MQRRTRTVCVLICGFILSGAIAALARPQAQAAPAAQAGPAGPLPLFLREDWKHVPDIAEHAVVQESVTTPVISPEIVLCAHARLITNVVLAQVISDKHKNLANNRYMNPPQV